MAKRQGWFARLNEHFHTHPRGRAHEFAFWFGLGAALLLFALLAWRLGWFAAWGALLTGVIALCLMGWAFLPQHRPAKPAAQGKHPKSKRR